MKNAFQVQDVCQLLIADPDFKLDKETNVTEKQPERPNNEAGKVVTDFIL